MRILITLLAFITFAFANIGKVSTVVGDAKIERAGDFIIIKTGIIIEEKDIIRTSKNSKVQLIFNDNTIITVGKNSALNINEYLYDTKNPKNSKTDFNFFKGAFKTITGKIGKINKKKFKLRTKTASIGIRGTIIVGNQSVIACTQGGITVEGAGVSVNVDANELTVIQENSAPSQAKTITNEDLQSLEQSIEPQSEATSQEATQEESEEEQGAQQQTTEKESASTEETTQLEKETNDSKNNSNSGSIEEENIDNKNDNNSPQGQFVPDTPPVTIKPLVITPEPPKPTPPDIPSNQIDLVKQAQDAAVQAEVEKNNTQTAQTQIATTLSLLPNSADLSAKQTQAQNTVTSVQGSLSSAVSSLNSASSTNSVDSSTVQSVNVASTSATSSANQALSDANTFQANVNGDYNTTLVQAQAKINEAHNSLEKAQIEAQKAQDALVQAQEQGLSSSSIASIQIEVNKANSAVTAAQTAVTTAQNELANKTNELNNTATVLNSTAQTAVKSASDLSVVSQALVRLEDTKQLNINAQIAQTQTATTLSLLLNSADLSAKQTQAQNTVTSVQGSLSSAVSSLNSASSTNSVDSSTVQSVNVASTSATSSANQALSDANTFQANVNGDYNTTLVQAQTKVLEAQTSYQNALTKAQELQAILSQAQTDGLDSSIISSLQAGVNKANSAVTAAQTAVTTAQNELTNKTNELNNTATTLSNSAQQATDDAALLAKVSSLLGSLEDTKQASIDAVAAKTSAQTAKTATQTALNDANSAKSSLETAKTEATNFKTATQAAKTVAEDVNSSATLVVSSARTANTNAASAQTKANEAITHYNQVNSSITAMGTQLQNAKDAYDLSVTKEAQALSALNTAKATEASIGSSNSSAKTAAQAAVAKAQTAYDDAVIAKNEALTAKNEAQTIFDNANTTTLLASALSTKNDAQTQASSADTLAKSAVSQVKNIVVSKTKTSLKEDGNSVDNSSDIFELSAENTNAQTTGQNFGGYTGTSQLGVFKENVSDANPSYLVQADNLLEVFVSYSSSTNPVDSLTVYGNNFAGTYDNSKIYVYKSFKTLETNGSSGSFNTETTISFYNPATNSFTSLSKDFYKEGASSFVTGTNSETKVIKNSFNLGNDVFLDSVDTKTSTAGTNAIKGSQAQGSVQTTTYSDASKDMTASFLNGKKDQDSSSITKSMTGQTFLVDHDGSSSTGNRLDKNLSITITDNGVNGVSITATPKYDNGTTITTYSGTTKADTLTAFYINSDIWGAKASSGNGFMIAVPDGGYDSNGKFTIYDENDNPLTSDDDSSWGYWTGTTPNGRSINPKSAWVAGIETSTAIVQGLIDGNSQTLTFNGKVMGTVDSVHSIVMDDTNKVALNFNVGGGSANLTGSMQFKSTNNHSFNLGIDTANTTVNSSGFTGKFTGSGVDSSYNYLNGKYYGDGEVKSVGGTFQARQNNHSVNGVFKATKQ